MKDDRLIQKGAWIDLHCHIIPGVDDGPQSLDDALLMIATAADDGTVVMVATPHRNSPVARIDDTAQIMNRFLALQQAVSAEKIPVTLLLGAEVYCRDNVLDKIMGDKRGLTLAGSDYFLLEFPPDILFAGTDQLIIRAIRHGLVPILVHPERNSQVQQDPRQLLPFVEAGALIQVTAGSLDGRLGANALECARYILKCNMVHVLASDCHDLDTRSPHLSQLLSQKILEPERAKLLMNRLPKALMKNMAPPDIGPPHEPVKNSLRGAFDWVLRRMR